MQMGNWSVLTYCGKESHAPGMHLSYLIQKLNGLPNGAQNVICMCSLNVRSSTPFTTNSLILEQFFDPL
jgi:hypothetical protein